MELITHFSIFAGILILYAFFTISQRFSGHRKSLPPEVSGGWPVIGHLHLLNPTEPTHITLSKMADAYGPIFTLRFGMNTALIVSSWEIAKECFTTNDRIFASRPKLVAAKLLGYDYAMFGASPYGPHWRHVRKIATLKLLSTHRLDQLQHIRESEVRCSMKKLYDEVCVGNKIARVEIKTWFGDLTLSMILRIVIGKKISAAFDGGDNEVYRKAMREFVELFGVFMPADVFPFLSWFDFGGHEKAMKKAAKVMDEVLDKWLREHRHKMNSGEVLEHDFMDVMLSAVKDRELSSYDADTVIKATCLALVLGGFDSTTVTMTWAISLLLNNEEVLRRAQLELDVQVGRERQVKESDIQNLIYLQAILKETLRLYPAGPLLIPHESIEDCTVVGYHIPAKTRLMVNVKRLQRDPNVWEDPCEFRPERFLTTQKDFDVRGQSPQLIPFGSGRRMCPGVSFALQIMHLILANLIHGFEIDRPTQEHLDMEESVGVSCIRKSPLEVVLTPRLRARVYE